MTIMDMLGRLLGAVSNDVAISAHVKAESVLRVENPVWGLSTNRATRMRMMLESSAFDGARIVRVTGEADRNPAVADPSAVRNNRVEIIVLRSDL